MAEYLKKADFLSEEEKELAGELDLAEMEQYMAESYSSDTHNVSSRSKGIFFQLYEAHKRQVDSYMQEKGLTDHLRDCDVNLIAAVLFCPYYSLWETYQVYSLCEDDIYDGLVLETNTPGENNSFLDRTEYQCPIYFFLAEDDLNCDPKMAEQYFESINVPSKGIGYTAGDHECTMYHSEDLVAFIHETVLGNA